MNINHYLRHLTLQPTQLMLLKSFNAILCHFIVILIWDIIRAVGNG